MDTNTLRYMALGFIVQQTSAMEKLLGSFGVGLQALNKAELWEARENMRNGLMDFRKSGLCPECAKESILQAVYAMDVAVELFYVLDGVLTQECTPATTFANNLLKLRTDVYNAVLDAFRLARWHLKDAQDSFTENA